MTPDEIRAACDDMSTPEEIRRMADVMRGNLGNLSRREAFAAFHGAISNALELAKELGAGEPRLVLAAFLLRECGADVAEAQRAVRQARAKADAEIAQLRRMGAS